MTNNLENAPLGKNSNYIFRYDKSLLFPIPRSLNRDKLKISQNPPFEGVDIWNSYELSWLNDNGKPIVAMGTFYINCSSINIIESKSFKLYLNSFNNSCFSSPSKVSKIMKEDLCAATESVVSVDLNIINDHNKIIIDTPNGICLDNIDVSINNYSPCSSILSCNEKIVAETLYSNLLKSNCLKTGQPDWATIYISYAGKQINRENLLKYIISYRNHNDFHEHCVENIYCDILKQCKPSSLTVYARYTRRGGLDINPFRTNCNDKPENFRLIRQ